MKLTGNNLVIVNILATYVRIVLSAGLMLFSTRWVLQALGKEDFGLFSVVGGLIVFILFIGNTMVVSVQRFFAYAIGQGDPEEVKKWFNSALSIHFSVVAILIFIGIPLGNFLLNHVMEIPLARLQTCHSVYYLSVLGAVGTMLAIPSLAMFTAKQRIFELSFWGTLQTIMTFLLAYYLLIASGDLLFYYALGMVGIKLAIDATQVLRARFLFPECRVKSKYLIDKQRIKKLVSFSSWRLFGGAGTMLKNQGIALLLNIYGNANINAAFGVGNQVSSQTATIGGAVCNAVSPEIISREGSGNRDGMIRLSLRTTKFVMFLTFIWILPLFGELDYILRLWLTNVPEYTAVFCKLVILAYVTDNISVGYISAVYAKGDIAGYQALLGGLHLLAFPLAWLCLHSGGSYALAVSSILLTSALVGIGRVFWVKKIIGVPVLLWVKEVFLRCLAVFVPSLVGVLYLHRLMPESFSRFAIALMVNLITISILAWGVGLKTDEKKFILDKVKKVFSYLKVQ